MSINIIESIAFVCAVLIASFIKGGSGLGAGIFLQPTLTLLFDPFIAIALSAPIILFTDIIGIIVYWRNWAETSKMIILFIACAIGLIIGILIIPYVPAHLMRLGVGLCGLIFVFNKLTPTKKTSERISTQGIFLVAICGGLLTAIANAGGILFAYCYLRMNLPPRTFVATSVAVALFSSIIKIPGYFATGILSYEQVKLCLPLFPVVLAGCLLGNFFNKRLNPKHFQLCVLTLIGLISLAMLCPLVLQHIR